MRGASSGSERPGSRQTSGSSTSRGSPAASSHRAIPEFVVPRSSAHPVIAPPL